MPIKKNPYLCKRMGRMMAIDYGTKRTGLAVSDTMQIIAGGLTTVPSVEVVDFICGYTSREKVDVFVVGLPLQMNNEPSNHMRYVQAFVDRLRKAFPDIPVEYYDERFTSVIAHRATIDGGLRKKQRQNKALIDEISATIILQDYIEKKRNM